MCACVAVQAAEALSLADKAELSKCLKEVVRGMEKKGGWQKGNEKGQERGERTSTRKD